MDQMDGWNLKSSPSVASNGPSAVPKPFSSDFYERSSLEEANREDMKENDGQFHQGIRPNSPNPKKGAKKFMSLATAISGASGAALSRKKILTERNDEAFGSNFSVTQMEKSPKIGEGETAADLLSLLSQVTPSSTKAFESGCSSGSASSYLPYDPLTNYLSPRPQFLRYKPNRRLEMFLHRNIESRNGEKGLAHKSFEGESPVGSSTTSSQDGTEEQGTTSPCTDKLDLSIDQETKEIDDDDDIDDEEIKESFWRPTMVLKSLLLFGILFFTTLYISSANRPAIPPSMQFLQGYREGYSKLREPLLRFTESMRRGEDKISETTELFSDANAENGINGDLMFLGDHRKRVDLEEIGSYSDVVSLVEEMVMETEATDNDLRVAGENEECILSNCTEQEEANDQSLIEVIETKNNEVIGKEEVVGEHGMVKTMEDSEISKLQGTETVEISDSLQVHQTEFTVDSFARQDIYSNCEKELVEITETVIDEGTINQQMDEDEIVELMEMTDLIYEIQEQCSDVSDKYESLHGSQSQLVLESSAPDIADASERELNSGQEDISLLESVKGKLDNRATIGLSLLSVLVSSIALCFLRLKSRKTSYSCQQLPSKLMVLENSNLSFPEENLVLDKGSLSFPEKDQVLEHCSLSFKEKKQTFEKGSLSFPEKKQTSEKVDSYANPLSRLHSNDNYYEYRTHPPMVELLGEYAVTEISIPKKSSDKKSEEADEEIKSNQSQASKMTTRKSLPFSNHMNLAASEVSMEKSPSYGQSVTSQEKLMTKEGSSDEGKVMNSNAGIRNRRGDIVTPIRRSSRIRNRVMSP